MPSTENYITQAAGDARYQALGSLGSSTPVRIDPDDAGTAGVSTSAARQDHEHPITTGTPVNISLANSNAEGAGTEFARNNHVHGHNPPTCRVFHSADQVNTNGVALALAFNSERFDTDTMHNTVTNNTRITFTTAGVYVVTGSVTFSGAAAGSFRDLSIRLNGATNITEQTQPPNDTENNMAISTIYKFAAGDYVELVTNQNSGGNLNVRAVANRSPEFSAAWVGVG